MILFQFRRSWAGAENQAWAGSRVPRPDNDCTLVKPWQGRQKGYLARQRLHSSHAWAGAATRRANSGRRPTRDPSVGHKCVRVEFCVFHRQQRITHLQYSQLQLLVENSVPLCTRHTWRNAVPAQDHRNKRRKYRIKNRHLLRLTNASFARSVLRIPQRS